MAHDSRAEGGSVTIGGIRHQRVSPQRFSQVVISALSNTKIWILSLTKHETRLIKTFYHYHSERRISTCALSHHFYVSFSFRMKIMTKVIRRVLCAMARVILQAKFLLLPGLQHYTCHVQLPCSRPQEVIKQVDLSFIANRTNAYGNVYSWKLFTFCFLHPRVNAPFRVLISFTYNVMSPLTHLCPWKIYWADFYNFLHMCPSDDQMKKYYTLTLPSIVKIGEVWIFPPLAVHICTGGHKWVKGMGNSHFCHNWPITLLFHNYKADCL